MPLFLALKNFWCIYKILFQKNSLQSYIYASVILIQKRKGSLEIWYKFLTYPGNIILLFREIEIEDLKEKRVYFFKANRWLAVEKGDGKVSCNLTPTKDEEISVSFFLFIMLLRITCISIDLEDAWIEGLGNTRIRKFGSILHRDYIRLHFFYNYFIFRVKKKRMLKGLKVGRKIVKVLVRGRERKISSTFWQIIL